jgi:AP-2 complex subunit alpha
MGLFGGSQALLGAGTSAIVPADSFNTIAGSAMSLTSGGSPTPTGQSPALTLDDPQNVKTTAMFKRLCLATEGVLYEDGVLQIGMKSEYQREMGRIMFYYGNSSMTPLTNFTTAIPSVPSIQFQPQATPNTIAPKAQVQQMVTFVCTAEFQEVPVLQISFISVKPVNITLRLPIIATKFTEPLKLMAPDFFSQWKNYGNKPLEAQDVFKIGGPTKTIDINWISKVVGEGLHLSVLKGVDPSINNIVAAGQFYCATSTGGSAPCLVRLETNPQANMCRVTVRSPSATLTNTIKTLLVTHLSS